MEKERHRIERGEVGRGELYIPPLPPLMGDSGGERRVSRGELYIPPLPPMMDERRLSRGEMYAAMERRRLGDDYPSS